MVKAKSVLFDFSSDLHIEMNLGMPNLDFSVLKNVGSDILVLAGDAANHYKTTLEVLKRAAEYYTHVLFIDGNHEHYNTKRPVTLSEQRMREFSFRHPEIVYLYGSNDFRIGDTAFIGCNGWYDWQSLCPDYSQNAQREAWRNGSNDSNYIETSLPIDLMAKNSAATLRRKVIQLDADSSVKNIVIITHTAPGRFLLDDKPWDVGWQLLSGSYVNTYMASVLDASEKITIWGYGHTHNRKMTTKNGVTFINNARGYASETKSRWFMVQLDSAG